MKNLLLTAITAAILTSSSPAFAAYTNCQCVIGQNGNGWHGWYLFGNNERGVRFIFDQSQGWSPDWSEMYNACARYLNSALSNGTCR
jgi:opacity protein-like surface antigen